MIRPPDTTGVAFSEGSDGDLRFDDLARSSLAARLAIPARWAVVTQVHGNQVVRVGEAGGSGEADALWTTIPRLPLAVFTADCFGVALMADGAVGVAHAGWRGAASGVVAALREAMEHSGHMPRKAAIGPGIGPCCFEVGHEVQARFSGHESETSWGTPSVDLRSAIRSQLSGLDCWVSDVCTSHQSGWFSHRKTGTSERMTAIGWVT